jgi:hypothetical protein
MKENKISIVINKSVQEVFTFTIDPNNTPQVLERLKVIIENLKKICH